MLKIGNIKIGVNDSPKIIAEISANHNQSLGKAIELIKSFWCGVNNLVNLSF